MAFLAPNPGCGDTSSCVMFMRLLSLFLHPDIAVANLSRPIPFQYSPEQLSRDCHLRYLEDVFREWRATFARS